MNQFAQKGVYPRPWSGMAIGLGIVISTLVFYYFIEDRWFHGPQMEAMHTLHLLMEILAAVAVVGVIGWYCINNRVAIFPSGLPTKIESLMGQMDRETRLRQHAYWFINLRWLAITVALSLIFISSHVMRILPEETYIPLLTLVAILVISNVAFNLWSRQTRHIYFSIVVQVVSDLVILTGLLNFSGGLENPLFIVYSFHVVIAGILLTKRAAFSLAFAACGLLGILAFGELFQLLKHYTILLFPHGDPKIIHGSYHPLYVYGLYFPFSGVLICVAYFTTLVMENLRGNEERLVQLTKVASEERQKLDTAINAMGAGMLLLDRDLRVLWFNKKYQEWFGRGDELIGSFCGLSEVEGDGKGSCKGCISAQAIEKGMMLEVEREVELARQGRRFYHITASPIRNENGEITQVVELIQDITARKAMEFEMLHTSKMAVLGRMAAGIAHEIGNPLSSMSTRIRLMENRREENFLHESLRLLQDQVSRIGRIIHGISQFARSQREEFTMCSINGILEEAVEVIKLDRRAKSVAIEMTLAEEGLSTLGSRDRFFQVFINIGLNAVEAMKGSGILKIRSELSKGDIVVSFQDTGPGLTEEARSNLFNPFYTTKEQGLGLGLFVCYSIINSYGGTIEVESEEGKGAIFTIRLPVSHHQRSVEAERAKV